MLNRHNIFLLLRHAAHRVALLAVMLLAVMLAACSDDSDNSKPDDNVRNVNVTLTLSVNPPSNSGSARSKAFTRDAVTTSFDGTWENINPAEDGKGFENYIDVSRLHVIFYDKDGNFLAEVQNKLLLPTKDENIYQVKGNMTISATDAGTDLNAPVTFGGKVVVYANVDENTDGNLWRTGLENVAANATYAYSAPTTAKPDGSLLSGMTAIPMWGLQDYSSNTIELKGGLYNDLGTIYLLRSMAKVSVHFTKEMREAGFRFTNIQFNNYNRQGCIAPPYANIIRLASTKALSYANSFHVPAGIMSNSGPLDFLGAVNDTVSLNLYIPEYQNVADATKRTGVESSSPATITIGFRRILNGVTTEYNVTTPLRFRDYTNGKPDPTNGYDIVRNHHYRYFILNDHLDLRLEVEPWTVVTHTVKEI